MNHGRRHTHRDGCRCGVCVNAVPHGTPAGYVGWRCRCEPCRHANKKRQQLLKLRTMRNVEVWGDVDAVKQHLRELLADGHSQSAIASALGWRQHHQVRQTLNADRVTAATAHRILHIDMTRVDANVLVPALGTARRLRALARAGYPINLIGDLIGFDIATLQKVARGHQLRVRRWVADAVTGYYHAHHMKPGPDMDVARRAATLGWHPPLAWDDNDFDDPRGQARARTRIKR